ncbi:hypothetical protein [Microlunatus soli]|uniref:Uncharacterized protein n=1 Tax=Microlunatus soli TaxID=630515 RepID=A0A1H1THD7_9ACTN|nr:hypothetical protein [Microlunatus soli]SDS59366.1 hypothetical protein SAMN04489812_2385 [Microlunatus soli]
MKIDWLSLLIVGVVSISVTAVFAVLLSIGIRQISRARLAHEEGRTATAATVTGWIALGLIGVMILFALYLIIPQFH